MKKIWNITKDAVDGFISDDIMTASAALAFYSALALAPLILLFVSVTGILGYQSQDVLIHEFDKLTGEQGGKAIEMIISSADKNEESGLFATIASLAVLAFSASAVFGQLQVVLNLIFDAKPQDAGGVVEWLRRRVFSIGILFSIGFLMIVSLILSAGLSAFLTGEGLGWSLLQLLVSFSLFTLVFALIFKFLPDVEVPWHFIWTGAALTSVLFSIGHTGISLYLGKSAVGSAYGAAGSLIVALVWVYYSSIILFFGAQITNSMKKLGSAQTSS